LRFFAHLYGLDRGALEGRCLEVLEKVELDAEDADERFMNYSSGMRQKLAIARSLLHDPPVLFMDEPTRSLDPLTARHLRALVREVLVGREGKTVLLATHNLGEAAEVCSRIGVLVRSQLRRVGSPQELRRWVDGGVRFRLEVEGVAAAGLPAGCRVLEQGAALKFETPAGLEGGLDGLLRRVHAGGGRVRSCTRLEASLEEVFDRICGEVARGEI
jgi:ABC-2 type transport system ATP-binding protein